MQVLRLFCLHIWSQRHIRAFWGTPRSISAWSFPLSLGSWAWSHHRGTCQRVLWSQDCISNNCSNIRVVYPRLRISTKLCYFGRLSLLLRRLLWERSGFSRWRHKCRSLAACSSGFCLFFLLCVSFSWPSSWCDRLYYSFYGFPC